MGYLPFSPYCTPAYAFSTLYLRSLRNKYEKKSGKT